MTIDTEQDKLQEYEPTPAERKILEVMLNPENRFLTVTDLCKQAEVSRNQYYLMFGKPEFVICYRKKAKDLIEQSVLPVIHAFTKQAKGGSFQHGKALLDMASMSNDSLTLKNPDGSPIMPTSDMSPKDAAQAYSDLIKGDKEK